MTHKWAGYLDTEKFGFSFGVKVFENLKKKFFTHYRKLFDVIPKRLDEVSLGLDDLSVEAGVSKGERHSDCDFCASTDAHKISRTALAPLWWRSWLLLSPRTEVT